jgi:hypothetical protein
LSFLFSNFYLLHYKIIILGYRFDFIDHKTFVRRLFYFKPIQGFGSRPGNNCSSSVINTPVTGAVIGTGGLHPKYGTTQMFAYS